MKNLLTFILSKLIFKQSDLTLLVPGNAAEDTMVCGGYMMTKV
jgi:hypothetical protein